MHVLLPDKNRVKLFSPFFVYSVPGKRTEIITRESGIPDPYLRNMWRKLPAAFLFILIA